MYVNASVWLVCVCLKVFAVVWEVILYNWQFKFLTAVGELDTKKLCVKKAFVSVKECRDSGKYKETSVI